MNKTGNDAREAVAECLQAEDNLSWGCDRWLAELWMRGFKLVPLDDNDLIYHPTEEK